MIKLTPEKPPYYENVEQTKVYIALLDQTGTNPPTAKVLTNTIGDIVWTRTGVGIYRATKTAAFPKDKTTIQITTSAKDYTFTAGNAEDGDPSDAILVQTANVVTQTDTDGLLYLTTIIITVKN